MRFGLDAFGNHFKAEGTGHFNDVEYHLAGGAARVDRLDEGFERVE